MSRPKLRVRYEEYINLPRVRDTWNTCVTQDPKLEPCFTAGMQGIELGFILLAHFVMDQRTYVFKRSRIELIAKDIQKQVQLLADILDGELEDEKITGDQIRSKALSLENGPPILDSDHIGRSKQSTGLEMLTAAVRSRYDSLAIYEQQSLKKIMALISGQFETCFREWEVKLGIEGQLSEVRELVGLKPLSSKYGRRYLDYRRLVRPEIIAETLTNYNYIHEEDFFFRSIHLGTECWSFITHQRLRSALEIISTHGSWYNGAVYVLQAANILNYLGDHIKILTSMVLKDYCVIKVELEGISGAGSASVKELVRKTPLLMTPLRAALDALGTDMSEDNFRNAIVKLYRNPDANPALYNYAKSLEAIDTAVIGGFFYSHYRLASNVIGSSSRGTINLDVQYLRKMCDRILFPVLDEARTQLGKEMDVMLAEQKGRMTREIDEIIERKDRKKDKIGVAATELISL